jgi:hypothetical protein
VRRVGIAITLVVLGLAACADPTVEPSITFEGDGCSSTDPSKWPSRPLNIEVSNTTDSSTAVVMGTYVDGYGHADLVAYGSDVSTRPDFIDALEIFQAAPGDSTLVLDHGSGTFFMVCMPDTNSMVVLDDVIIEE